MFQINNNKHHQDSQFDSSSHCYTLLQSQTKTLSMRNKNHSESNADTEDGEDEDSLSTPPPPERPIRDVWAHNLDEQLRQLALLSSRYGVLALDTQFPGNLVKKQFLTAYYEQHELEYQTIWHNVEKTKLIQIGISIADNNALSPAGVTAWQFHLAFDLLKENTVPESIELLKQAGIPFQRLPNEGIPPSRFAQAFISSGLILNKSLKWVVFHGCYDFAYLLRLLRGEPLPKNSQDFYKSLRIYFPTIFDVKEVTREEEVFRGDGLAAIAAKIGCSCVGPLHQAGSDSLLTLRCYFQLRKILGDRQFDQKTNLVCGITPPPDKKPQTNSYPYLPVSPHYHLTAYQSGTQMGTYPPVYYQSANSQLYPSGPLYQYLHQYPAGYQPQSGWGGFGRST